MTVNLYLHPKHPDFLAINAEIDRISEMGNDCARTVAETHFTAFDGDGPEEALAEAETVIRQELDRLYARAGIPDPLRPVLIRVAVASFQIRLLELRLTARPGGRA